MGEVFSGGLLSAMHNNLGPSFLNLNLSSGGHGRPCRPTTCEADPKIMRKGTDGKKDVLDLSTRTRAPRAPVCWTGV